MRNITKYISLGFMLFACILLSACGNKTAAAETLLTVKTQSPERGNLLLTTQFVGNLTPKVSAAVVSFVTGEVLELNAAIGDYVNEGDMLARIDDEGAQLQLKGAQAQLEGAQAQYNTAKSGVAQATGGAQTLQDIQTMSGLSQLQDQIVSTQHQLDETRKSLQQTKDSKSKTEQTLLDSARFAGKTAAETAIRTATANPLATYDDIKNNPTLKDAYDKAYKTYYDSTYEQSRLSAAGSFTQIDSGIAQLESAIIQMEDGINQLYVQYNYAYEQATLAMGQIRQEQNNALKTQLNAAAVGIDGAALGIESAQFQLDMYTLTAPISGMVESVLLTKNGFAQTGSPAFIITDKTTMQITFYVSEAIRDILTIGQEIVIHHDSGDISAAITEIGTMLDMTKALFKVTAEFKPSSQTLLTGTMVKLSATTYTENDTLLLPYDCVYYDSNAQAYVYIMQGDTAKRRDVSVGRFDDTQICISDGVSESDTVIVTWNAALRDGAKVRVVTE